MSQENHHVHVSRSMRRSDAGSTAPTGSEHVKLISAISTCETRLMTDTCAGGICPRGSDATKQMSVFPSRALARHRSRVTGSSLMKVSK